MSTSPARLPPLPEDRWDDEARRAVEENGALLLLRPVPNSVTTLLHHPRLAGAWLAYNTVLLRSPALPPRLRELAILRAMWRTASTYLWLDHVRVAMGIEMSLDDIGAIPLGPRAGVWSPLEAAVLSAADQLVDGYSIDEATWGVLAEHLDAAQLLELPFVVGSYVCLTMVYKSVGTEVDDFLKAIPAPAMPESDASARSGAE
ncbi:MAG: carboxymuconolactone decarboxylase family protein [Acidimicrobiales bacterium]